MSSTDTLPLQLCYQCASTLIAWDSMINSCLEADKKLRAMQESVEESKTCEVKILILMTIYLELFLQMNKIVLVPDNRMNLFYFEDIRR